LATNDRGNFMEVYLKLAECFLKALSNLQGRKKSWWYSIKILLSFNSMK